MTLVLDSYSYLSMCIPKVRVSLDMHDSSRNETVHSVHKTLDISLYILYTMYMIYNLPEFRSKTREAFEKAKSGEEVIIERFAEEYKLTYLSGGFKNNSKIDEKLLALTEINEVQDLNDPKLKELFEELPVTPRKPLPGHCSHGYNLKTTKCKFGCKK